MRGIIEFCAGHVAPLQCDRVAVDLCLVDRRRRDSWDISRQQHEFPDHRDVKVLLIGQAGSGKTSMRNWQRNVGFAAKRGAPRRSC